MGSGSQRGLEREKSHTFPSPAASPSMQQAQPLNSAASGAGGKNRARFHSAGSATPSPSSAAAANGDASTTNGNGAVKGSQRGLLSPRGSSPDSRPLHDEDFTDGVSESSPSGPAYGGVLHSPSPPTSTPTHSTHTAQPATQPSVISPLHPLLMGEDSALRALHPALQLQQLQQLQQQQHRQTLAPLTVPGSLVPLPHEALAIAEQQQRAGSLSPPPCAGLGLFMSGGERPSSSKFRLDMMTARSSTHPMDRYKALTRLSSALHRELLSAQLKEPQDPCSWTLPEHQELLWKIYEVGEALAMFGTADFGERTNSSRAITNKDYAYLLRLFGERFWGMFSQEFIDGLPQVLQDDATAVRGLLITRLEANSLIGDHLLSNVGKEQLGQQGGGTVSVFNTTSASANPVNAAASNPQTCVQTAANAASKLRPPRGNGFRVPAFLAASFLSGWLLKRAGLLGLLGLAGGRRGRSARVRGLLSSSEYEGGAAGGRHSARRVLNDDERLLAAYDHADVCSQELRKAEANGELLKNDWRLGTIRLSSPFGGPYPPGFQPVDMESCEPRVLMHKQLGVA